MGKLSSLASDMRDLGDDIEKEANSGVGDAFDDMEQHAKRVVVEEDAVASTQLYRGFYVKRESLGRWTTRHVLGNRAPHARFVEFGTGDKWGSSPYTIPPLVQRYSAPTLSTALVDAIEDWIDEKPAFRGDPSAPDKNDAYAIALAISGELDEPSGTKPVPFMRSTRSRYVRGQYVGGSVVNRAANGVRKALRRV